MVGYLLAGLGGGAVVAALAIGLVLCFRTSGVVNFAYGAMGMYAAFVFVELRRTGELLLPVVGLPSRVALVSRPTVATALVVAAVMGAVLGAIVFWLVFRPLRAASSLARVVASLGLLVYLQEVVRLGVPASGAAGAVRSPVLPEGPVRLFGTAVGANRLWLAALAVVVAAGLGAVFRWTRFGLATRAAATNDKGALLAGLAPDRLAVAIWAGAGVLAGLSVVLIEPIAGLDPTTTPLLVVPALAAALLGGLRSFAVATAAGLGIGMVQSLLLGVAVDPATTWLPTWLPVIGLQQAVPVVVIVVALVWRGDLLPPRAAVPERPLPPSPAPRRVALWSVVLAGAVVIGLLGLSASWRQALIVSMIYALVTLSVVVITGYVGQISLAQLALAGVAGFTVIRAMDAGVPFVLAGPLAALVAMALGVVVGLPATRVRGMTLAVATLAVAVAVEELVLASPSLSGGAAGSSAPRPDLFGLDIGVGGLGADNFRPAFGLVLLAVVVVAYVGVANLRRGDTGLRWLAVRANERAAAAAGIDVPRTKLAAFALSSLLAGAAGVFMALATTTLSPTSFMVIGALVAVALTYLAGVSSLGGALLAATLAQAGVVTTALNQLGDGEPGRYVFALSGIGLMLVAVLAPAGLTGLVRTSLTGRVRSRRHRGPDDGPTTDDGAHRTARESHVMGVAP
jgi:branched-chain amino acid transport system permease protein